LELAGVLDGLELDVVTVAMAAEDEIGRHACPAVVLDQVRIEDDLRPLRGFELEERLPVPAQDGEFRLIGGRRAAEDRGADGEGQEVARHGNFLGHRVNRCRVSTEYESRRLNTRILPRLGSSAQKKARLLLFSLDAVVMERTARGIVSPQMVAVD